MTDKKKDYWFFGDGEKYCFPTLNEARAEMYRMMRNGEKDGGVIFCPVGHGVMILFNGCALWNGQRADQRPVREDGSLYPQNMVKELRGF